MPDSLTIITYHYVRPLEDKRFPKLKGLDVKLFDEQLSRLLDVYTPVSMKQVKQAILGQNPLPNQPVLLTFDDGYSDHIDHALPVMLKHGFSGAFFPAACSTLDRTLLDINKIQFTLATGCNTSLLVELIDDYTTEAGAKDMKFYRDLYWHSSRWDDPQTNFVKKMLQTGLPAEARSALCEAIFARFVSNDERAFADELYMSVDDLRELEAAGMHVGGHGSSHQRLSFLCDADLMKEVEETEQLLLKLTQQDGTRSFCYPHGSYDDRSIAALEAHSFELAFTTEVGIAPLSEKQRLRLPRLDTNDVLATT